ALVEEAAPRVAPPAERAAAALSEDPPPDAWLDRDDRGLDDLAGTPFDNGTDVPNQPNPQEDPHGEIH
ncbi:MAG: hypothetical protein IK066_03590, partial [Kiritimatiellae bacterium]|nr:hypothetical protein [Kiritimatiellia bacterium]